ncbi:MAG TPA: VOC family protein [Candidatus Corynebacterium avicola]|uniref:VOC family protein n=1 Tax=Candidatus Corynebacterium avicola TaxID=2838527 RepID=A0A9D1UMA3_9CORY|nr:VOC family protein [Candidatus Corynebacterium avicola]
MTARFNHTIIASRNLADMAEFYIDLLEATPAQSWGIFTNVTIGDGVMLQFAEADWEYSPQHYAYLVDDEHFDRAHKTLRERGIEFWADPQRQQPGKINHNHDGRGVYILDPSGHYLELITNPYL